MSDPSVSIIIPAFNSQNTLTQTLESLLAQTYGAWEAIVIDDGSADLTPQIAKSFTERDKRIRLVQQPNGGEGAARNTGLRLTHAAWLVFLDSDDWLLPSFLERMTNAAGKSPDTTVLHCGWVAVGRDGRLGPPRFAPTDPDLFPRLSRSNCFAIHTCLVRREIIGSIGPFDVTLKTCSDWDFWQRVARTGGRFTPVPEVLACYRLRPDSAGTQPRQLLVDALEVIERGHRNDGRVPNCAMPYSAGMPSDELGIARLEMMCWAAGLSIGRGESTNALFEIVPRQGGETISPDVAADVLFEAIPIPVGEVCTGWRYLWPKREAELDVFLATVEIRLGAAGWGAEVKSRLTCRILREALPAFYGAPSPPNQDPFAEVRILNPVSHVWGYDRGLPVDRYYIERFLARHESDITGRVLEVGDNRYTTRYGRERVTMSDVLHVTPGHAGATFTADLNRADHLPSNTFNCIILTQTLQFIFDIKTALHTLGRMLKPGGVLLASFPGLTRTSRVEWPGVWYWRLTPASAKRLFEVVFSSDTLQISGHGNVLAACAFLYGMAAEELTPAELDYDDPDFDVVVTVRVRKSLNPRELVASEPA